MPGRLAGIEIGIEKGEQLMNQDTISPELIEQTINFHGHSCPGLAIGIRASELALSQLERASDEEIVAVVETDMCAVDAVQFLTGCTFGKGNLIPTSCFLMILGGKSYEFPIVAHVISIGYVSNLWM